LKGESSIMRKLHEAREQEVCVVSGEADGEGRGGGRGFKK